LAASASGVLREKISEIEGLNANLSAMHHGSISFELKMKVSDYEPLIYSLSVKPTSIAYEIEEESLSQQRLSHTQPFRHIHSNHGDIKYYETDVEAGRGLTRPTWDHDPLETSLAQVPKMFQEPEEFRKRLASSTHYHVLNVEPRSPVRLPQPLRPANLPGKDGEDLVSCLFFLRETDRDRFEVIEETLRAGFSDFERLDFPPVAAGTLAMTWKDRNFQKPMYMHQLSEGTLRFLWLVTLLQSPGLTAVTLIDEPEVSLHPELLSLLADLLREASARTQVIVATHADRLVRFLDPKEVLILDVNEEGFSHATWADDLNLDEWLQEYSLDELWRMGRMGGRP
jgi:predicted ATPase